MDSPDWTTMFMKKLELTNILFGDLSPTKRVNDEDVSEIFNPMYFTSDDEAYPYSFSLSIVPINIDKDSIGILVLTKGDIISDIELLDEIEKSITSTLDSVSKNIDKFAEDFVNMLKRMGVPNIDLECPNTNEIEIDGDTGNLCFKHNDGTIEYFSDKLVELFKDDNGN